MLSPPSSDDLAANLLGGAGGVPSAALRLSGVQPRGGSGGAASPSGQELRFDWSVPFVCGLSARGLLLRITGGCSVASMLPSLQCEKVQVQLKNTTTNLKANQQNL